MESVHIIIIVLIIIALIIICLLSIMTFSVIIYHVSSIIEEILSDSVVLISETGRYRRIFWP